MNFYLKYSVRKKGKTFSDVPLLPGNFPLNDTKSRVPLVTFQLDFPETFCKW